MLGEDYMLTSDNVTRRRFIGAAAGAAAAGIALAAILSASSLVTVFADAEGFDIGEAIEDPSLIEAGTEEPAENGKLRLLELPAHFRIEFNRFE